MNRMDRINLYKGYRKEGHNASVSLGKVREYQSKRQSDEFTIVERLVYGYAGIAIAAMLKTSELFKLWIKPPKSKTPYAFPYLQALRICRKHGWYPVDTIPKGKEQTITVLPPMKAIKYIASGKKIYSIE